MKRWGGPFLIVLVACGWLWSIRMGNPEMLNDTDTAVLLRAIRERSDPLSWFGGDWPLQNHFYRPISTLAFEFDNWRYANDAAGYGATNALLCIVCVMLLFWFLREFTDSHFIAAGGAVLFALWHGLPNVLPVAVSWFGWAVLVLGAMRHGLSIGRYFPAFAVLQVLSNELWGMVGLYLRMVAWLPGRTASVMAVFCLIAMAAYARYERLRRIPAPLAEARATDPPAATRTSVQVSAPRTQPIWVLVSLLAAALALASYEQAVMLPAAILGLALTFRFWGHRPSWGWVASFWGILVGYLVLRSQLVPSRASGYQLQQFRDGPGVLLSILDYLFPSVARFWQMAQSFDDPLLLVTGAPYSATFAVILVVVTFWAARRAWPLCLAGWLLSALTFLPMAWLKQFDHYHYWPMAMRTLLVAGLVQVAQPLIISAWSRQARPAPPRLRPAPGSQLHP